MTLYHGSGTGGLQTLTPRLADHGQPYVYLAANRVVAAFYCVRAVEPPYYWTPYGFDRDGTPVYHELYPDALRKVYGGKRGYLYRVEPAKAHTNPMEGIPGALIGRSPLPVAECVELPDVCEWLLREEAAGRLRVGRYQKKTREELDGWYAMIRREIAERGLRENPDCSYARFLRENIPQAWEQQR